jgi:hypothetical protein
MRIQLRVWLKDFPKCLAQFLMTLHFLNHLNRFLFLFGCRIFLKNKYRFQFSPLNGSSQVAPGFHEMIELIQKDTTDSNIDRWIALSDMVLKYERKISQSKDHILENIHELYLQLEFLVDMRMFLRRIQ